MRSKPLLVAVLTSVGILLFASVAAGVIEHEIVRYERPVRGIRGRLTAFGQVVPALSVQVFDNGQVWLDDSIVPFEKKKQQNLVASVEPDGKGEFRVKGLRKGFYEVEFGNGGNGGYNVFSVLVNVDPKGADDRLCIDVSLESVPGPKSSVRRCTAR